MAHRSSAKPRDNPGFRFTLCAGVLAFVVTWLIYSPIASWTSTGITFRMLGTLVGIVALSALLQHRFRGDENWLGLGLSLGLGLLAIFSIGILWLFCALLFGLAIWSDDSNEPRISGRGLTLQAIGFALVLIATFLP